MSPQTPRAGQGPSEPNCFDLKGAREAPFAHPGEFRIPHSEIKMTDKTKTTCALSDGRREGSGVVQKYEPIYDPAALREAISQLKGTRAVSCDDELPGDGAWHAGSQDTPGLTSEDANRLQALERIAADPRGHRRRSIMGSPAMVRRIKALSDHVPHFAPAIDLVARAALVSVRTATPMRLPPVLLLGEPGIGKSYTLRRLAEAVGADFALIAANMTDAFRLRGLNTAWRGARQGRIAEILLGASTTPVVLVDEFDKANGDQIGRAYDSWHSLLERENARGFKDDFLELEFRVDRVMWFASANDIAVFPNSILDRLLTLEIPAPSEDQLKVIIASIYAACRNDYGGLFPEQLAPDVSSELACQNPRHVGRLLDLAIGFAAADRRRRLRVEDIRRADVLASGARRNRAGFRGPVGFTRSAGP